jgi:hypothetical protein
LIDLLDPKTVFFDFQMSSMRVVGDPITYFNKFPGRFISMHLQGVDVTLRRQWREPPDAPSEDAEASRSLRWVTTRWTGKHLRRREEGRAGEHFVEQHWDLTVKSVAYLPTLNV